MNNQQRAKDSKYGFDLANEGIGFARQIACLFSECPDKAIVVSDLRILSGISHMEFDYTTPDGKYTAKISIEEFPEAK
jgi:hypothetical protein